MYRRQRPAVSAGSGCAVVAVLVAHASAGTRREVPRDLQVQRVVDGVFGGGVDAAPARALRGPRPLLLRRPTCAPCALRRGCACAGGPAADAQRRRRTLHRRRAVATQQQRAVAIQAHTRLPAVAGTRARAGGGAAAAAAAAMIIAEGSTCSATGTAQPGVFGAVSVVTAASPPRQRHAGGSCRVEQASGVRARSRQHRRLRRRRLSRRHHLCPQHPQRGGADEAPRPLRVVRRLRAGGARVAPPVGDDVHAAVAVGARLVERCGVEVRDAVRHAGRPRRRSPRAWPVCHRPGAGRAGVAVRCCPGRQR